MHIFLATFAVSFLATYLLTPKFMTYLEKLGLVGTDIQKRDKPKIPEMGGPIVLIGFLAGVFAYIWVRVFFYGGFPELISVFAAISTILIITFIGLFDDLGSKLNVRQIKDEFGNIKRIGLKQWQKPLLTLPAAIPLMAIMAGNTSMLVPFIGTVDFGILYPLLLVPLAVMGAANATNMLAGLNGLEAGLGFVVLLSLGIYTFLAGEIGATVIAIAFAGALLAFLRYNWYPAKIMPGDSLAYTIGAVIATVAIIGNVEKFAVLAFLPWFLELVLKLRSKLKAESL